MIKLLVVLAVAGISTSSLAVRFADAPAVWIAFARLLLATAILLPFALTRFRQELLHLKRKVFLRYALSGVVLGLHFLCYFESVKNTSIAAAVVLACCEVFFVAIGARFLFREPITVKGWAGILTAFVGCVLVTTAKNTHSPNALLGNLLGLAAAVLIAVNTLITKHSRKEGSTTAYTFVAYGFAALTLCMATFVMHVPILGKTKVDWLSALWLAVVCTMLGHSVLSYSLKYERASYVSAVKLLAPVFAALLGWLLFREAPALQVVIGSVIIIGSVYYYSRQCTPELSPTPNAIAKP